MRSTDGSSSESPSPSPTSCSAQTAYNYENNFRMGISAGYNILSGHGTLVSLSAAFGGSVYTQYHRSLYYDLCAKWGTSAYFKPLVGLGVRYYQSLGNTGRDRLCLYVSIGFRFN